MVKRARRKIQAFKKKVKKQAKKITCRHPKENRIITHIKKTDTTEVICGLCGTKTLKVPHSKRVDPIMDADSYLKMMKKKPR